jgi:hypothetical protein
MMRPTRRLGCAALALFAVVLGGGPRAFASFPGANGRLVFSIGDAQNPLALSTAVFPP